MMRLAWIFCLGLATFAADIETIIPRNAAKPVGPYSPGLKVGDYLYVSGQGVNDSANHRPGDIQGQTRQCLANVRAIVEAGGFTMDQIIHAQLYVADISKYRHVEKIWKEYFQNQPPRITLNVARMPTDTTVEITVVAHKGTAADRVYLPEASSLKNFLKAVRKEKLTQGHVAAITVYHTAQKPAYEIEQQIEKIWNAGRPAITVVEVPALPSKSGMTVTGVAAREIASLKREGNCSSIGDTNFCSLSFDDPAGDVEQQTKSTLEKLSLNHVVATNVYMDSIDEFGKMNAKYAEAFNGKTLPTRTTVQPLSPGSARYKFRFSFVSVQ